MNRSKDFSTLWRGCALLLACACGPALAGDFWDELAANMELVEIEQPRIDTWEKRIRRRGAEWTVILRSGRDVLYPIVTQVRAHGLPPEFALIPAIESAFLSDASSDAGASGLWQLMPATAAHLGLEQSPWIDGRADLIDSTRAALAYLGYLHARFDDWLLALAAYNAGESRVAAAMRRNRKAGLPTDYWHLDLPGEAMAYVPQLLALARVVHKPQQFRLPFVENRATIAAVTVGAPVSLDWISRESGLSLATLYRLNPQLKRWALAPGGSHRLYVPAIAAPTIESLGARAGAQPIPRWTMHQVSLGDTLSELAMRFDTSINAIRSSNGIHGNLVRVGDRLLIPAGVREIAPAVAAAAARRGRIAHGPEDTEMGIHVVRRGESMWSIARHYGLSVNRLRDLNGIRGAQLVPGQRLLVGHPQDDTVVYVVRPGDALWHIADRYKLRVRDIRRWNDLGLDRLIPGQRLTLFVPQSPTS